MYKRIGIITVLIAVLSLSFRCGPGKVHTEPGNNKTKTTADYIFYPALPNTPRFQYLTTFSTSKDIRKKQSKLFKFVAGDEQDKPREIRKAYGIDMFDGIIYVSDISSGAVVTLDLKAREFGYLGISGAGKLLKPVNLVVDKINKQILVADMGRKQVMLYSLDGRYLKSYGKNGQFEPSDVDIFEDKLFVCDVKAHQVHVLERENGKTLYKIGKPGSAVGQMFHPTNICIAKGRLYVSETNNYRVQVFDLKGNSLGTLGKIGDRPGDFSRNKGVAVDRDGRIYVVDAAFENVQVFNKERQILLFMFGPGRERHNINLPAGVAVDYENLHYFKKYLSPNFDAEYLLLVTSNFGLNKVNVYAYGSYRK